MVLLREVLGRAVGRLLAPAARVGASMRHARLFHPEGITLRAEVRPLRSDSPFSEVAERLAGPALVRLSTALWRGGREWPDLLGAAVRFCGDSSIGNSSINEEADEDDQDVLFATVRTPWTVVPSFLSTRIHDWLQNDYYAVSPFNVQGLGIAKLRLVSVWNPHREGSRVERLKAAMGEGQARFTFELHPRRLGRRSRWTPIAEVTLCEEVTLDPALLRFDPFRGGRGITPRGFVHAQRLATYRQSQEARARHH